jgi:hypothetical protein
MNKEILLNLFTKWLAAKGFTPFPVTDPFLLQCLDNELENALSCTINGVTICQYYEGEALMLVLIEKWLSTAKAFLQLPEQSAYIVFGQTPLPAPSYRSELLFQLSQLVSQCVNE